MPNEHDKPLKLTVADLFHKQSANEVVQNDTAPYSDPQSGLRAVEPVEEPAEMVAPRSAGTPAMTSQRRPKSVLHVRVVTGCGGGPDKTILRSPRYADPTRYTMAAAYIYPQGDPGMCVIRHHARQLGCPLYEIAEAHALDLNTIRALIELCRELKVDIWHGHDYKSNLLGLMLKRFHAMKLVTTAHGFTRETWRTRLYYHVDNLAMLGYDQVIAVSPKLIKHCAYHGIHPDRLTLIANAIDTQEYTRSRSTTDAKKELGLPTDRFAIGVIGRLSIEKGQDRAIRMLPGLLRAVPNAELHLIGDGPMKNEWKHLADELGVGHAIRWWGWQTDARPVYEMLDLLLLPSRTEGLPNVVLEAMAMGVSVAATHVGGVPVLLDRGDCGLILHDDDQRWAGQLIPLIKRESLRESYADLALRRVRESYNFQQRMQRVMRVYDKALGIRTPANSDASIPNQEADASPPRQSLAA